MGKSDTETQRVRRTALLWEKRPLSAAVTSVLGGVPGELAPMLSLSELDAEDDWTKGPLTSGEVPMRLECDLNDADHSISNVAVVARVLGGRWSLRAFLVANDQGPEFTAIELRPADTSDVLGSRLLRKLGFGEVVEEASRWLNDDGVGGFFGDEWVKPLPRPGRRGRSDVFYARWAQRYVDALAQNPKHPIKHIVDTATEPGTTASQVRWYLTAARERNLLTEAPAGGAGGELTDKARLLLTQVANNKEASNG